MNVETVAVVVGLSFSCGEALEAIVNHTPMVRRGAFRRLLSGVSLVIPFAVIVYTVFHLLTR